jgi:protoporphyrinogen oxidase
MLANKIIEVIFMENDIKTKYLIVGAGISGLSFANFLRDDNYLILEKENEVGGLCRTIRKGNFIWDYAGHFFHFKDDEMKKFFYDNMKHDNIISQNKNTKILYKNSLIDYPFQLNIHQLDKDEFIDCLYDLYTKKEKESYNNFLDMVYGKFGKAIVEKFLKPYNEKLYACNLNSLDQDAMGRFFPYANIDQIIKNMKKSEDISYNNKFIYPEKGAGSFLDSLYNNLDKSKIKLSTEIKTIDLTNKKAITNKNQIIYYDYLINTSPLNKFTLLFNDNINNNLRKELSYNKVLVFNLGFKNNCNQKEHWIYIPDKSINYYRIGFYNNILNAEKLSMYIEIGFGKDEKIDIEKQLNLTLENLRKIGIIKNNELEDYTSIIIDPAYVHITKESNKKIKEYMLYLNSNNIYSIGRYGAWTYCSMEDCMLESKKLCEKLI